MPTQKKQQYVPKCLLKNFSVENKVYVFQMQKNKLLDKPVPYESQCYAAVVTKKADCKKLRI